MEPDNTITRTVVGRSARSVAAVEGSLEVGRDILEGSLWAVNEGIRPVLTVEERAAFLAAAYIGLELPEETPMRVARYLETLAKAPQHLEIPVKVLGPKFQDKHNEMVIVKDISFTAVCEHHLLPFQGHAAVGYIPQGQIVGLSKLARLVNYYCGWPTLQEHITTHVADALHEFIGAKGTMVVLYNVVHSCMSARGVEDPDANTTTSAVRGVFREVREAREEFLQLLLK